MTQFSALVEPPINAGDAIVQPPFRGPSDFGVAPQGRSRPVHTEKTKDAGYPETTHASELLRVAADQPGDLAVARPSKNRA